MTSFPRKNADRLKKDRTRPNRPARRCTAAVFYPTWRTTGVHHKKGQPSAATSHEARPGNPSFCILCLRTSHTRWGKTDNSNTSGPGKLLGFYPTTSTRCYTTTRCNIEPASKRQPRHQRRHKTLERHKMRRSSRFRAAGKQTAAKRGASGKAREPGTTTLYRFTLGTSTAHRLSLRPTTSQPILQRKGLCIKMG